MTPEGDHEPQISGEEKDGRRVVNIANLVANHFGISTSTAVNIIASGEVEINGKKVEGSLNDKLEFPEEELDGKEIVVVGDVRHFKLSYNR